MTNLAELLMKDPESRGQIAGIYTINGSYGVAPDKSSWNPRPSWNVRTDPEAAKYVIESGIPVSCGSAPRQAVLTNRKRRGQAPSPKVRHSRSIFRQIPACALMAGWLRQPLIHRTCRTAPVCLKHSGRSGRPRRRRKQRSPLPAKALQMLPQASAPAHHPHWDRSQ